MNKQHLIEQFGIKDVFDISENEHGLIRANVTTATGAAEIYLQGAHLTQWIPKGQEPVLYLSDRSFFQPGKAIRGGVPLIFPWFGPRTKTPHGSQPNAPSHGFARTSEWQLVSAGLSKDDFLMTFELTENEASKAFAVSDFKLIYKVSVGAELELELIVENLSGESMHIEEAFHTYIHVGDVSQITVNGLENVEYLDKTDGMKRKRQSEKLLSLTGETDRPYLNTEKQIDVTDPVLKRTVSIDKLNSQTTVVWNPWKEQTAKLSDMSADGWQKFVCVESANVGENAITLRSGEHHIMHSRIRVT